MARFSDELGKAKRNLTAAENALDSLIGPRTNVMMKKLDEVTELSEEESEQMFGFEERDELQINTYEDNGE